MKKNNYTLWGFIALPIILILLCYLINLFAPTSLRFPKPAEIVSQLFKLLKDDVVRKAIWVTFTTLLKSLFVASVVGIILGYILGYNLKVWNISQPTVDFFRSIPVTFLIPASALLLGVNNSNIVWILSAYPGLLVMIFAIRTGIMKQEPERLHFFKIISHKHNFINRFFKVTFFETLPDLFSGFRITLSYGLVIVTVLEYMRLGNQLGLGGLVNDELEKQHYSSVYAFILLIGLIGFVLNKITELIQNKYIHWSNENSKED